MSTAVLKQPSDADLVAASRAGDREAFGAIVARYQGLVSGFVYNRCRGDILRSEELSQETFITAWQSLTGLKDPSKLGTWLCGIARNIVNSAHRRDTRQQGFTEQICDLPSHAATPPDEAISREQQHILWQSLERVPETYREPMVLYYRHGQSVTEVAQVLELQEATVRKRLERGRSLLRDQIASFVEDSLKRTAPNAAFTVAVLAALPAMSSKATAATFGAGVVASAGGSKLLVFLASWLGPILGIVGGCYGAITSVRQTRTPRERRFVIRRIIVLTLVIFCFWGWQFGLIYFREALPRYAFVPLNTAAWVLFATFIAVYSVYINRRQQEIRSSDGPLTSDAGLYAPWTKPAVVYGALGGGILGGNAWVVGMGGQAGDWITAVLVAATAIVLFLWSTQTILRRGPAVARRVMLITMSVLLSMQALVVNLRLNSWLQQGADLQMTIGQPENVPHVSLWAANILLLAVGVMMLAPILLTKDFSDCRSVNLGETDVRD